MTIQGRTSVLIPAYEEPAIGALVEHSRARPLFQFSSSTTGRKINRGKSRAAGAR
jgi:hypothetical protein